MLTLTDLKIYMVKPYFCLTFSTDTSLHTLCGPLDPILNQLCTQCTVQTENNVIN